MIYVFYDNLWLVHLCRITYAPKCFLLLIWFANLIYYIVLWGEVVLRQL